jgi:hypothetical protein
VPHHQGQTRLSPLLYNLLYPLHNLLLYPLLVPTAKFEKFMALLGRCQWQQGEPTHACAAERCLVISSYWASGSRAVRARSRLMEHARAGT